MRIFTFSCIFTFFAVFTNAQTQIKFENERYADSIIASYPNLTFERLIPHAPNPELEQRHRKAGLHLWYLVEAPVKKFQNVRGIETLKETELLKLPERPIIVDSPEIVSHQTRSISVNDPLYYKQWHYHDTCQGAIKLAKAWEIEQGKRNVVVAVMDSWIDYTHPDLAANMWTNEKELNGLPGIDDDGNGYVDDIHGLNFLEKNEFGNHGTHIAGTIVAVNNNGIGVCGIAGGNGVDTGARLMSIGISGNRNNFVEDYLQARGYVYAADNGAIISSNSWGGNPNVPMPIISDAIAYFMENAGQYEQSPMNGGLVVFSAGNENTEVIPSPLNDPELPKENLIVVASVAHTGMRSTFSNYGSWIDVSAPGGEFVNKGIYSTLPDGKYGFMNGTSMACPHVSGVAALVVSKFASPSLTPTEVKRIIIDSSAEVDAHQTGYPFATKLGGGILDALAALCPKTELKPNVPTDFKVTRDADNQVCFTWKVPTDANGNQVAYCSVYSNGANEPLFTVKTTASKDFCVVKKEINSDLFEIEAIDAFGNRSSRSVAKGIEDISGAIVYNPFNTSAIITHRPNNAYNNSLPLCKVVLPCSNVKAFTIDDQNGIVTSEYIEDAGELCLLFNVEQSTPLGTHPLIIKYCDSSVPENYKTLNLSYIVNEVMTNTGPVAKDGLKMNLYTSEFEGYLELNLRDYVSDPAGLDFIIPDTCYEDESFTGGYEWIRVNIKEEKLQLEYRFDDMYWEPMFCFSVKAINSYQYEGAIRFTVIYEEETGITNINSDKTSKRHIYNIQGQEVNKDFKNLAPGIYIVGDSKKIVK